MGCNPECCSANLQHLVCKSNPEFSAFIPQFCNLEPEYSLVKNVCLSRTELSLSGTPFEDFVLKYIFPLICLIGIIGNAINLLLLLSREMRSRYNATLAVLSVCDISTLLLVIPHSLAHFDIFGLNLYFRSHYLPVRNHLVGLTNWCHAVTAWLTALACTERLMSIRFPFRMRQVQLPLTKIVISIIVTAFVITSYEYFAYECVTLYLCGSTQVVVECYDVTGNEWRSRFPNFTSNVRRDVIKIGALMHMIIALLVPLIILLALERMLFTTLKIKSQTLEVLNSNRPVKVKEREKINGKRFERRLIFISFAVLTCYIITKMPSALILLGSIVLDDTGSTTYFGVLWHDVKICCCLLLCLGKCSNFVILLSSKAYRKKLLNMLRRMVGFSRPNRHSSSIYLYNNRATNNGCNVKKANLKHPSSENNKNLKGFYF